LRIVAEAVQPGVSVSSVARRHGLHPNQVFIWRTQAGAGELVNGEAARFVPVAVSSEPSLPDPGTRAGAGSSRIEIVLANGRRLIVDQDINVGALMRIIGVVERR
jgi:transposase